MSVDDTGLGAGDHDDVDADVDLDEPRPRRIGLLVAVPLLVVLAAFIVILGNGEASDSRGQSTTLLQRQAPPVVGETFDGTEFALADAPGEYVLVNFFATWCVPCIREHPDLVSFAQRHAVAGDASVVSVLYDTRLDQAREFFAENGGDWPVVLDQDGRIALGFGVSGVPESYLVAPDGVVVAKIVGGVSASRLDQLLADIQARRS